MNLNINNHTAIIGFKKTFRVVTESGLERTTEVTAIHSQSLLASRDTRTFISSVMVDGLEMLDVLNDSFFSENANYGIYETGLFQIIEATAKIIAKEDVKRWGIYDVVPVKFEYISRTIYMPAQLPDGTQFQFIYDLISLTPTVGRGTFYTISFNSLTINGEAISEPPLAQEALNDFWGWRIDAPSEEHWEMGDNAIFLQKNPHENISPHLVEHIQSEAYKLSQFSDHGTSMCLM